MPNDAITGAAIVSVAMAGVALISTITGVIPFDPIVSGAKASHRASHVGDEPNKQVEQGFYNGETYHRFFSMRLKYYDFTLLSISLPFQTNRV